MNLKGDDAYCFDIVMRYEYFVVWITQSEKKVRTIQEISMKKKKKRDTWMEIYEKRDASRVVWERNKTTKMIKTKFVDRQDKNKTES